MLEQKEIDVLRDIWNKDNKRFMVCPRCGGSLTVIQLNPVYKPGRTVVYYKTVIECDKCSFNIRVESCTVYGAVRSFNDEEVEISSWSSTGSRTTSVFRHSLDRKLLEELRSTGELVEFLIVDDQVVVVIG
ncbi:MAG TPA: hypothetical protein ENI42_03260 [Thermoplasmatales archaeon]|nr:hypothetical protein [Thermoplasmatales archaeon]